MTVLDLNAIANRVSIKLDMILGNDRMPHEVRSTPPKERPTFRRFSGGGLTRALERAQRRGTIYAWRP